MKTLKGLMKAFEGLITSSPKQGLIEGLKALKGLLRTLGLKALKGLLRTLTRPSQASSRPLRAS